MHAFYRRGTFPGNSHVFRRISVSNPMEAVMVNKDGYSRNLEQASSEPRRAEIFPFRDDEDHEWKDEITCLPDGLDDLDEGDKHIGRHGTASPIEKWAPRHASQSMAERPNDSEDLCVPDSDPESDSDQKGDKNCVMRKRVSFSCVRQTCNAVDTVLATDSQQVSTPLQMMDAAQDFTGGRKRKLYTAQRACEFSLRICLIFSCVAFICSWAFLSFLCLDMSLSACSFSFCLAPFGLHLPSSSFFCHDTKSSCSRGIRGGSALG